MRFGPYIEGGLRPVRLRLKTQTAIEEILAVIYKQDVFINKNMNEEEKTLKELKEKIKQKNCMRMTVKRFF